MEYVTISGGKIDGHFDGPEVPDGATAIGSVFDGVVGDDERMFDWTNGGERKPKATLAALGLIPDNRGTWYGVVNHAEITITDVGVPFPPDQEYVSIAPLSDWDEWDGDQWVLNTIKEAAWLKQRDIDTKQDAVDKKLAETLYDLTSFIKNRFLLNQTQIDQIQAMTTVAQIKNVILDRFSLTQVQQNYIENFRTAYEEWINLKT